MSIHSTRRGAMTGLASALALSSASSARAQSRKSKPNIIFFMGEGLRPDEFSFMGNKILRTPNMDRIANEGAVFRNAFCTNALCLPSRASFLTGAYSHTTGATTNDQADVPANFKMVTDILRDGGYETAFLGKSHVGGALLDHKWDYYFGFKGQANYLHPEIIEGRNGDYDPPRTYDRYVDDILTEKAVEWILQRGEKPFCLFLWFFAPHAPFYRPRRLLNAFNGVAIPIPENFDDDLHDYPGKARAVANAENKIGTTSVFTDDPRSLEELVKDHYAGVENNDDNVGKVVSALSKIKQLDDSAILISSDHGFFLGEHTFYDKRLMYEPSIRIPMILRWPGRIPPGSRRNEMVLNVDVAQTLLDVAGLEAASTMQGQSFLSLAQGKPPPNWRKDWLYEYYEYPAYENVRPHRGVRTERYKLIHFFTEPQEFELYDLQADPNEDHNLYGRPQMQAISDQLKARIVELRKETRDTYVYQPSRSPRMTFQFDPPTQPRPWRPNGS